jgi:hypothetical protein
MNESTTTARSRVNYRRGFRRIGFVVWVVYAAIMLLLPLWLDSRERERAQAFDGDLYQTCLTAARDDAARVTACWTDVEHRLAKDSDTYRLGSVYASVGWHLLWVVPCALLLPPLAVYGLVRAIVAVGFWVFQGFRAVQ